jgi:zinc/manganese transport system permease protein
VIYALLLALWFGFRERIGRIGFYVVFGCTVTVSVQLVGLYLVFTTLVVPALATYYRRERRLLKAYSVGALGYALGLLLSVLTDLPSGAMIVCALAAAGLAMAGLNFRAPTSR